MKCICAYLENSGIAFRLCSFLGPVHTGADPFGSGPKLERIGLACTRDLLYPIQFGSAIRTSLGRIEYRTGLGLIHSGPMGTRSDPELERMRNEARCY